MSTFSGIEAMHRAQADIGRSFTPQGMCLNHNFIWSGIGQSVGPGAGHYGTAMDAWNYATKKETGPGIPPAGVPIYFGVSPTRTDANKAAGDVGWSVGNGIGIFTDASGAKVAPMTIAARAKQTQRPYLGWARDFLGWDIAEQLINLTAASVAVKAITNTPTITPPQEATMFPYAIIDATGKILGYNIFNSVKGTFVAASLGEANLIQVTQRGGGTIPQIKDSERQAIQQIWNR